MFNYQSKPNYCQLLEASSELAKNGNLDVINSAQINFDQLIEFIMALPNNMSIDIAKKCQSKWFDDYSQDIFHALQNELNYSCVNV